MKLQIKNRKTGEEKEVTIQRWSRMQSDGRSRHYSVVPEKHVKGKQPHSTPKQEEKIEIEDLGSKEPPKRTFGRPAVKKQENQEKKPDEKQDDKTEI